MEKIKTFLIVSLLLLIFLSIFYFIRNNESKKRVEYLEEGERMKVLDEKDNLIFDYSIEQFRNWAKDNWEEIFQEAPSFGKIRKVDPVNFYRFDQSFSLSPQQKLLVFSVHDYAAATTISFVGIINLKRKEIDLIKKEKKGSIEHFIWSPKEDYLAYSLDSARASGDYLSIDNLEEKRQEIFLTGEDILNYLKVEKIGFMPEFNNLRWREDRLYFETSHFRNEKKIQWSVKQDGSDLRVD